MLAVAIVPGKLSLLSGLQHGDIGNAAITVGGVEGVDGGGHAQLPGHKIDGCSRILEHLRHLPLYPIRRPLDDEALISRAYHHQPHRHGDQEFDQGKAPHGVH